MLNFPVIMFAVSLLALWLSTRLGASLRRKRPLDESTRQDFDLVSAATLTLLGLIIGFTFSMAIGRYDQRKNYEEDEANAIGAEYLRVDLLRAAEVSRIKRLLRDYLQQRILFYESRDASKVRQINAATARIQSDLWSAVRGPAVAQPSPLVAVAITGMNDVLNSQGYTQAAWWNRIPVAAWVLLTSIAICCCLQIGYRLHSENRLLLLALPLIVSVSFLLIADIDSPRGGIIRVRPVNLISVAESL
jgi:hypothetical protein